MKDASIKFNVDVDTRKAEEKVQNFQNKFTKQSQLIVKAKVEVDKKGVKEVTDGYKVIETFVDRVGKSFQRVKEYSEDRFLVNALKRDTNAVKELGEALNTFIKDDRIKSLTTNFDKSFRETSKNIKTTVDEFGNLERKTTEFNSANEKIITTVKKYKNELGQLVTETEKYDATNERILQKHTEISESIDKQATKLKETNKSIETYIDKSGNMEKIIREADESGKALRTTITQQKDELGNLITITEKYDEVTGQTISINREVTKTFNEQKEAVKNTSKETETLIDIEGNMVKTVREIDSNGKEIKTTVTQVKDELGNVITITEKYDVTNNKLISTNREVTKTVNEQKKALEEEKNKLKDTSKEISTFIDRQGNLEKKIIETDNSGKQLTTTIKKTKDEFGNVTTTTTVYDEKLKKLVSRHQEVANATQDLSAKTKSMGQSFLDCVGKVTKFYLATKPIQLVTQAITEGKEALLEYDKALTEFKKVSNLATSEISSYVSELNQIGQEVGRTVTEMIDSVTQMRKAGYSEEDAKYLAKLTELYKNTADEELTSAEASAVLISQMKAFNIEAENAIRITDSING